MKITFVFTQHVLSERDEEGRIKRKHGKHGGEEMFSGAILVLDPDTRETDSSSHCQQPCG